MHYAELHCLTNFSFLEAASHPHELVARAAELGYSALAITDSSSLAGVVRASTAAKDHSLKLIIGSEIRPLDAPPVVLWVKDRRGYSHLCRLITLGRRRATKGECQMSVEDVAAYSTGLLAGVVPPPRCEQLSLAEMQRYRDIFGTSCYLLAELHQGPHDHDRMAWLQDLSRKTDLPLVAAGNVLFHIPARKVLHDVLTAIRLRTTVALAGDWLLPNAQRHLRSLDELRATFAGLPQACVARWPLPTNAPSRSTNCVTNIPKNWLPRACRRWNTCGNSPGKGHVCGIPRACPIGFGNSWNAN